MQSRRVRLQDLQLELFRPQSKVIDCTYYRARLSKKR